MLYEDDRRFPSGRAGQLVPIAAKESHQTPLDCFKEVLKAFYESQISKYCARNFPLA